MGLLISIVRAAETAPRMPAMVCPLYPLCLAATIAIQQLQPAKAAADRSRTHMIASEIEPPDEPGVVRAAVTLQGDAEWRAVAAASTLNAQSQGVAQRQDSCGLLRRRWGCGRGQGRGQEQEQPHHHHRHSRWSGVRPSQQQPALDIQRRVQVKSGMLSLRPPAGS